MLEWCFGNYPLEYCNRCIRFLFWEKSVVSFYIEIKPLFMITRSFYWFHFFVNNQQNRLYVSVNHLSSDGSHYTPNFFKIETQICQQLCVICKNDRVHSFNVLLAEYIQLQKLKGSFLVSVANFTQHIWGQNWIRSENFRKTNKNILFLILTL